MESPPSKKIKPSHVLDSSGRPSATTPLTYLSLAPSRSGGQLSIPTSREARADRDVFISLDDTVKKVKVVMAKAENSITFIRAPVASGKTTLAVYLATNHQDEFVIARFGTTEDEWFANIIRASGKKLPLSSIMEAIEAIGQEGKTIVIDEAHTLFQFKNVVALLTKGLESLEYKPKILLFSASGSAVDENTGRTITTPTEITNKYVWYPPTPDSVQLMESLREAADPILLTEDSVTFFLRLCGGHRGIFMRAMKWVQECQRNSANETDETTCWDVRDCVSHVRKSFDESRKAGNLGWSLGLRKAFKDCRAVRVSGDYSSVSNIPDEFGHKAVLTIGSKEAMVKKRVEEMVECMKGI